MRIRTAAIAIIAALLVGANGIASWLFWPLPDPRFDWENAADQLAEIDEATCQSFDMFIYYSAFVDAEMVMNFHDEEPIQIRCAGYPKSMGDPYSELLADMAAQLEAREPTWGSFRFQVGSATSFWRTNSQRRKEVGSTSFNWKDVEFAYRCIGPLRNGVNTRWYNLRHLFAERIDGLERLSSWERRYEWCSARATALADSLEYLETSQSIMRLQFEYREFAREYDGDFSNDVFP